MATIGALAVRVSASTAGRLQTAYDAYRQASAGPPGDAILVFAAWETLRRQLVAVGQQATDAYRELRAAWDAGPPTGEAERVGRVQERDRLANEWQAALDASKAHFRALRADQTTAP